MLKKILVILLTIVSVLSMTMSTVEAARMGGGKSFGRQSSNVAKQKAPAQSQAQPQKQNTPATSATPAPKPASPWKGLLGGALLGLGLGALFSSLGMGAGMASMISTLLTIGLIGLIIMFLVRLFRQKSMATPMAKQTYSPVFDASSVTAAPEIGSRIQKEDGSRNQDDLEEASWHMPADFDVAQFERVAQTYFIRLQAAWDKADIEDIRTFTTPEMYAEITLQIQERGQSASFTDVLSVHAHVLGIETQHDHYLASVKFVGTLKEGKDAPTTSFEEVWNLTKPIQGSGGWLLAGIQQIAAQ